MEYVIKANGLNISYGRDEPIITDASMQIKAQEFVFITGKSGSGKSTIIKSLYGELFPNRGDLNVCGVDFKNISSSKLNLLRRYLGVVFQDYKLIDEWTVEQNVMLPLIIGGFSSLLHVPFLLFCGTKRFQKQWQSLGKGGHAGVNDVGTCFVEVFFWNWTLVKWM